MSTSTVTTPQPTFPVESYDDASVLKACGFAVTGFQVNPDSKRIILLFSDPDGKAAAVLERHAHGELSLPTLDLLEALRSVKGRLFDARRRSGLDAGRGGRR